MALTPDDVVNQKFTITKFRDGYDLDQVDDFLDSIVEELRQHEKEKQELRDQIEELERQLKECEARATAAEAAPAESAEPAAAQPEEPAPAQAVATQPTAGESSDAIKSSSMLQLALELHDKHVHEGETKRDELVREGEAKARELVDEARHQRAEQLRLLGNERDELQNRIKELREFESEYRTTLRSYIQAQLRNLDGSPEPDSKPGGLD